MGGVWSIVTPLEENVDCSPAPFLQVTVVMARVPWGTGGSVTEELVSDVGVWGWRSDLPAAVPRIRYNTLSVHSCDALYISMCKYIFVNVCFACGQCLLLW